MIEPQNQIIAVFNEENIVKHTKMNDISIEKTVSQKNIVNSGDISNLFDKNIILHFENVFNSSETGNNSLNERRFKSLLSNYIPHQLVGKIYRAIDVNDTGSVNYSDFTNYLISAESSSTVSAKTNVTRLIMHIQQSEIELKEIHKELIDCMVFTKKPCPMIITGDRNGKVSLWNPKDLTLIKVLHHKDKNSFYQDELNRSMYRDTELKARCSKHFSKHTNKFNVYYIFNFLINVYFIFIAFFLLQKS
jgi:hypothetical protein